MATSKIKTQPFTKKVLLGKRNSLEGGEGGFALSQPYTNFDWIMITLNIDGTHFRSQIYPTWQIQDMPAERFQIPFDVHMTPGYEARCYAGFPSTTEGYLYQPYVSGWGFIEIDVFGIS
jgi:hypothetical protein